MALHTSGPDCWLRKCADFANIYIVWLLVNWGFEHHTSVLTSFYWPKTVSLVSLLLVYPEHYLALFPGLGVPLYQKLSTVLSTGIVHASWQSVHRHSNFQGHQALWFCQTWTYLFVHVKLRSNMYKHQYQLARLYQYWRICRCICQYIRIYLALGCFNEAFLRNYIETIAEMALIEY